MTAVSSVDRPADMSPRTKGRYAGALYLLYIIAGVYAQGFVADRLYVAGNAAATAANILANQSTYRLGLTVYLLEMAGQIATVVLFYQLLKPVSRTGAMLAAAFISSVDLKRLEIAHRNALSSRVRPVLATIATACSTVRAGIRPTASSGTPSPSASTNQSSDAASRLAVEIILVGT